VPASQLQWQGRMAVQSSCSPTDSIKAGQRLKLAALVTEALLAIHARQLHGGGLHMQHSTCDKNYIEVPWPGLLEDLQGCIALKLACHSWITKIAPGGVLGCWHMCPCQMQATCRTCKCSGHTLFL